MSTRPFSLITPRRRLIGLAVVCAVFTAMGAIALAVNPTETINLIIGVGAMSFFGIGGGFSIASQWRRSTVLTADDSGIHIRGAGTVPWPDVERIGANASLLGIRLRNSAAFLAEAAPDHSAGSLRASRSSTGWDLTWPATLLGRTPHEAAAGLESARPQ